MKVGSFKGVIAEGGPDEQTLGWKYSKVWVSRGWQEARSASYVVEMRLSGPMIGRLWTVDPTNQEREGH